MGARSRAPRAHPPHTPAALPPPTFALSSRPAQEAMRRLAEEQNRPRVERNNFKCSKCHRVTAPDHSPLLLCDTCPRSFHMCCLGASWTDLPAGTHGARVCVCVWA